MLIFWFIREKDKHKCATVIESDIYDYIENLQLQKVNILIDLLLIIRRISDP